MDVKGEWRVIDEIVFGVFVIDICLSFTTAYYDEQILVTERDRCVRKYCKGWFIIDFLSTFPFDKIPGSGSVGQGAKLLRALRLVRLVKIARILKMSEFFEEYEDDLAINPGVLRLFKLFLLMGFAAHINACIFYRVADAKLENGDSWISSYCLMDDLNPFDDNVADDLDDASDEAKPIDCMDVRDNMSKYITAVYWAFTTMTTVGYGDIGPNNRYRPAVAVAILAGRGHDALRVRDRLPREHRAQPRPGRAQPQDAGQLPERLHPRPAAAQAAAHAAQAPLQLPAQVQVRVRGGLDPRRPAAARAQPGDALPAPRHAAVPAAPLPARGPVSRRACRHHAQAAAVVLRARRHRERARHQRARVGLCAVGRHHGLAGRHRREGHAAVLGR